VEICVSGKQIRPDLDTAQESIMGMGVMTMSVITP